MDQTLIDAVKAEDIEMVKQLLNAGADVNQGDEQGWPPLNHAAGKGNLEIVKLLLEEGSDPFSSGQDRRTPSMIALAAGRVDVAKYLLEVEDRIDPEKAKALRPVPQYSKAYQLKDLRIFPGWQESRINWKDDKPSDNGEFADTKIAFVHQDLTVTESAWHGENVIFNQINDEWREFCESTLGYKVPSDLDLMVG